MLNNFLSSKSHKGFQYKELMCFYNRSLGLEGRIGTRNIELWTKKFLQQMLT